MCVCAPELSCACERACDRAGSEVGLRGSVEGGVGGAGAFRFIWEGAKRPCRPNQAASNHSEPLDNLLNSIAHIVF